jgi:hypothetical protein
MSNSELDNQGGYRIWDGGLFGRDVGEIVEYIIIITLIVLVAKYIL